MVPLENAVVVVIQPAQVAQHKKSDGVCHPLHKLYHLRKHRLHRVVGRPFCPVRPLQPPKLNPHHNKLLHVAQRHHANVLGHQNYLKPRRRAMKLHQRRPVGLFAYRGLRKRRVVAKVVYRLARQPLKLYVALAPQV